MLESVNNPAAQHGPSVIPHPGLVRGIITSVEDLLMRVVMNEVFYLWRDPILLLSLLITTVGVAVYALAPIVWLAIILLGIGGIATLGICILRIWHWNYLRICELTIAHRSKKIDEDVKSEVKNLALEKKKHEFKFPDLFPDQQNSAPGQEANENITSPIIRALECEKFIYSFLSEINRLTAANNFYGMDRFYFRVLASAVRDAFTRTLSELSEAKDNKTRWEVGVELHRLFANILEPGSFEAAPGWVKNVAPPLYDSLADITQQCGIALGYLSNREWASAWKTSYSKA
jgi:hypothetical protein